MRLSSADDIKKYLKERSKLTKIFYENGQRMEMENFIFCALLEQ